MSESEQKLKGIDQVTEGIGVGAEAFKLTLGRDIAEKRFGIHLVGAATSLEKASADFKDQVYSFGDIRKAAERVLLGSEEFATALLDYALVTGGIEKARGLGFESRVIQAREVNGERKKQIEELIGIKPETAFVGDTKNYGGRYSRPNQIIAEGKEGDEYYHQMWSLEEHVINWVNYGKAGELYDLLELERRADEGDMAAVYGYRGKLVDICVEDIESSPDRIKVFGPLMRVEGGRPVEIEGELAIWVRNQKEESIGG